MTESYFYMHINHQYTWMDITNELHHKFIPNIHIYLTSWSYSSPSFRLSSYTFFSSGISTSAPRSLMWANNTNKIFNIIICATEKCERFDRYYTTRDKCFYRVCSSSSLSTDNYWSSHWVLIVPDFAKIFTRKRFWQLWSNLHLNDNTKAPARDEPNYDKLFKIRPMLDMVQHLFRNAHHPSQQASVDEAMVCFKRKSSFKQYMPMKPIKMGFKKWFYSDANSGYLQEFQIYTGKEAAL